MGLTVVGATALMHTTKKHRRQKDPSWPMACCSCETGRGGDHEVGGVLGRGGAEVPVIEGPERAPRETPNANLASGPRRVQEKPKKQG